MNYFEQLRGYLISALRMFSLKKLSVDDPGTIAGSMVSAYSYMGVEMMGAIEVGLDRLDLSKATVSDLDAIADNYALSRNDGTPAVGYVNLWNYGSSEDVILSAGTLVNTADGITFVTTQDAIILADPMKYPVSGEFLSVYASPLRNSVQRYYALPIKDGVSYDVTHPVEEQVDATIEIPIQSIETGRSQNIDAHEITETGTGYLGGYSDILDAIDNGVDNSLAMSGGSDAETDEEFRSRIKLHMAGTSTTTADYLEAAALLPGIDDAKIIESTDENSHLTPIHGAVYLVVASARATYNPQWAYEEATTNELRYPVDNPITTKEQVRNLVENYRSVGVGVIVREAEVVRINIRNEYDETGDVIIFVKPGTNLLTYTQLIETRLQNLFQSYNIGKNVYKSEIIENIRMVDAVTDIGPFNIIGERWELQSDGTYALVEYSSADTYIGESSNRRSGLTIYSEEIARGSNSFNFRLVFDISSAN